MLAKTYFTNKNTISQKKLYKKCSLKNQHKYQQQQKIALTKIISQQIFFHFFFFSQKNICVQESFFTSTFFLRTKGFPQQKYFFIKLSLQKKLFFLSVLQYEQKSLKIVREKNVTT